MNNAIYGKTNGKQMEKQLKMYIKTKLYGAKVI